MKNILIALAFAFVSVPALAQSDLATQFKSMEKKYKGPFGKNLLQGTKGNRPVLEGMPAGKLLFQAAFRNDMARNLVSRHEFYTANLFTTNYYELIGEYVYGNASGSHELNHEGLLSVSNQAMPKATVMVRHWVLEQAYVELFPNSGLAKAFRVRGISGSEFEQEYARYFLNFFLSGITNDEQYLMASLLAQGSPIVASKSLDRARNLIASIYESARLSYGESDPRSKRLYDLRNAIHNQLSQGVIAQIDQFLRDYPAYRGSGSDTVSAVRELLVSYYAVSAKTIVEAARKIGNSSLQAAAEAVVQNGSTAAGLLRLSQAGAELRSALMSNDLVATSAKSDTMVALLAISRFVNKELPSVREGGKDALKAVVNLIYMEGFLLRDNWEYFMGDLDSAPDARAAAALLPDIVGIAGDTLTQAFSPALDQWVKVEPRMNYFIDNVIKSSALNTASLLAEKIQR